MKRGSPDSRFPLPLLLLHWDLTFRTLLLQIKDYTYGVISSVRMLPHRRPILKFSVLVNVLSQLIHRYPSLLFSLSLFLSLFSSSIMQTPTYDLVLMKCTGPKWKNQACLLCFLYVAKHLVGTLRLL